jgi:hypothetical protein
MDYASLKLDALKIIIEELNIDEPSIMGINNILKQTIFYEPKIKNYVQNPDITYDRLHPLNLNFIDRLEQSILIRAYIKYILSEFMLKSEYGLYVFDAIIVVYNKKIILKIQNSDLGTSLVIVNLNDHIDEMIKFIHS